MADLIPTDIMGGIMVTGITGMAIGIIIDGSEGSSSFLKKRTKKLLSLRSLREANSLPHALS